MSHFASGTNFNIPTLCGSFLSVIDGNNALLLFLISPLTQVFSRVLMILSAFS